MGIQSISEQIRIAKQVTLADTQALLVATAKQANEKVLATDPRPASFRRFVDGNEGAPEEAVKAAGVIVYEYQRLDLVAQFALDTLRALSPTGSNGDKHPGLYRDSHTAFVNGDAVRDFSDLPAGAVITITNPQPYARKIEVGGRFKMTVPGTDHVYQQAQRMIAQKYGKVARVAFSYEVLTGGAIDAWASSASARVHAALNRNHAGVGKRASEWLRRQPALTISEF